MENNATTKKITVVGLGCAGVKVVSVLDAMAGTQSLRKLAIDTDAATLAACPLPPEDKLLADEKWRNGRGCGGDVMNGQRSLARERRRIEALLNDASLLILTGGLGGGTATGGAAAFAGEAARKLIPTVFIMTTPFSLEGHSKRRIAENGIRELLPVVDVLLCLPNDLLFSSLPAETRIDEAFKLADAEVASSLLGVCNMLCNGNLLAADFADINEVLNKRKSFCSIGVGVAGGEDGPHRTHIALERMLNSPLLGGAENLKKADTALVSLLGGSELTIGETKKTLESIEQFIDKNARLIVGANTEPDFADKVQITVIAIKLDHKDVTETAGRSKSFKNETITQPPPSESVPSLFDEPTADGQLEQGVLPLQNISRGIFLNSTPFQYAGEDLDIPTFQRRTIFIDKGK